MKPIKARIKAFFHWIRCHQILIDRYLPAYQPGMSVIETIWCYDCNEVFYHKPVEVEKIKSLPLMTGKYKLMAADYDENGQRYLKELDTSWADWREQ